MDALVSRDHSSNTYDHDVRSMGVQRTNEHAYDWLGLRRLQ